MSLTGYRPSALPPCGLAADLPIVADPAVFELPVVYCGGGTTTTMLKIRSADLREALGAPGCSHRRATAEWGGLALGRRLACGDRWRASLRRPAGTAARRRLDTADRSTDL